MEFADDIVLGSFTSADFDNLVEEDDYSERTTHTARAFSGFQLSVAISAFLHVALASAFFYLVASELEPVVEVAPGLIRVEFVSSNPLLVEVEEIIPVSRPEIADPIFPEILNPPLPAVESESSQADVAEITESELVEASPEQDPDANSTQRVEAITIPSVESVQRVLSNLQRSAADASRFYSYDCNKLEEEDEFSGCSPTDSRDYSQLTRNPVYDFHNPAIEITRSRETVTTLARQSAQISAQLASGGLPGGVSSYVLEELEQSIEVYSNNTVRALNHMDTMVDKSAAGVMARRINDNWVQQQSKLLQSRRVENRSERQFSDRCKSYEKFIMAPTEFARCLSIGESPLGFTIEF